MEYLIDLRFDDKNYCALIHFVTTFQVKDEREAEEFVKEIYAGFKRKKVLILNSDYYRIDNDATLRARSYEYLQYSKSTATASIQIEQFHLANPDQNMSLVDNLIDKFFNGEKSTANIGKTYNIPVRVTDRETRNSISGEFYYFAIEHLIPKE